MAKSSRTSSDGSLSDEKQASVSPADSGHENGPERTESTAVPVSAIEKHPSANLSEEESAILHSQVDISEKKASVLSLLKYSTRFDVLLLTIAYVCSIAGGAFLPVMTIIFGQLTQVFTDFFAYGGSAQHFQSQINHFSLYYVYLGVGDLAAIYIATLIAIDRGEVISSRIRVKYLEATLRQNVGYFDKVGAGEITNRITADMNVVQSGMSEKVTLILTGLSSFFAAFVVGFIKSWKLTLILGAGVIAMLAANFVILNYLVTAARNAIKGVAVGSSITEEVFSSIRNVQAFGIQDRLAAEYDKFLAITDKWASRQGLLFGCLMGTMWFCLYSDTALGYWQGSRFLASDSIAAGNIVTVLMAMVIGSMSFGQIGPNLRHIASAVATVGKIYDTIDRQSAIDSLSSEGEVLESVEGNIELKDVKFIYPSRPDVTILEDFNLSVHAGQTVALVGSSGSGKSTIIGLIERFYQPISGVVTLDGHDITKLNTRWLRQQISLVSQEPTLFACSVYENIAYGLIGTPFENAPEEEKRKLIINACEQANAMQFIDTLPEGLNTNVGERGFLMSGGQKQRIAIARAIVSNPKILLLDEATSALDTKSEGIVQDALDRASESRTTIVIAHRLSTIRDADLIVVMEKGKIVEQGTHNELLDRNGVYAGLVSAQQITKLEVKLDTAGNELQTVEVEKKLDFSEDDNILDLMRTQSVMAAEKIASPPKRYSMWSSMKMIYKMNSPERPYMLLGFAFAVINGLSVPVQSVLMSKSVTSFQVLPAFYGKMRHEINLYSGMFFMLAIVEGISYVGCMGILGVVAQKLVRRIRFQSFRQLLRQDISYFDRDENTVGSLTSMLAKDAQSVEGLTGATLGQLLNSLVTIIAGIVLSLAVGWKFALVCTACMPLLVGCGFFRFRLLVSFQERARQSYNDSATFACEATGSIRTVASLTREEKILSDYRSAIESQVRESRRSTYFTSFLYALTQALAFFITGLAFWYGGGLLKTHEYGTTQFFIPFVSILQGAQSAGVVFSFAPDMGKAREGAMSIQTLFDSIPTVDSWSEDGIKPEHVEGDITFENVHFRYPTRLEVPVLRGLNLNVKKGQYVALVGSSGCGKSTTIGLIESFYRPHEGRILLDGVNINDFNVAAYRNKIALVQQEPVLYAGTIKYNIVLGAQQEVTTEEIYEAAKQANIHDFIMSLPDGYDTLCGNKGMLLSGGQKQRVAIARALIRKPAILLLDEATSALDSESEKVVQEALDRAAKGRTTIAVAHRLSTIQKADIIYVFEAGKVLESGTHQELLANRSKYYELVQLQALERTE